MSLTIKEVELYIKLTLKQYKLQDHKVTWNPKLKRCMGLAYAWEKRIELSPKILSSFQTFKQVLDHEAAHCIQYKRNGNSFQGKNGRNDFHGKLFKQICAEIGVSSSRFVKI